MRWLHRTVAVLGIAVVFGVLSTAVAGASFSNALSAASTVGTKRIFPTSQAVAAWDVSDASAGSTAVSAADPWLAVDGRTFTTSTLTSSFTSSRYVELTLSSPLPGNVPVSSVTLNVTMAQSGGGTGCVYAEVRRASTSALLGTQGSSSSPLACSSSTTQATTTSNLTYITSSSDADDLKIKVFVRNSSSQSIAFDRLTVTGTTYSTSFTLAETSVANSSSGTATTTPWSLAAADTTTLSPASAWTTSFSSARYLTFTASAVVPTGATITGVTLRNAYANASGTAATCVYLQVYSGATLLGTHGSSASPLSCNSTATQATDVVSLPEVDTPAEASSVSIKLYVRNASSGATRHGLLTLTVDYSLT